MCSRMTTKLQTIMSKLFRLCVPLCLLLLSNIVFAYYDPAPATTGWASSQMSNYDKMQLIYLIYLDLMLIYIILFWFFTHSLQL